MRQPVLCSCCIFLIIALIVLSAVKFSSTKRFNRIKNDDEEKYGPIGKNEICRINYRESRVFGGLIYCKKCEDGYENPHPKHQHRCTKIQETTTKPLKISSSTIKPITKKKLKKKAEDEKSIGPLGITLIILGVLIALIIAGVVYHQCEKKRSTQHQI